MSLCKTISRDDTISSLQVLRGKTGPTEVRLSRLMACIAPFSVCAAFLSPLATDVKVETLSGSRLFWDARDDKLLLLGAFRHGLANLNMLQFDPLLDFPFRKVCLCVRDVVF